MGRKTSLDRSGRWRSKTIAFRATREENELINDFVKSSGLSKQDYIIKRLTCSEIKVIMSPTNTINLKDLIQEVVSRLERIETNNSELDVYLLETINHISRILDDMKGEDNEF